MGECFFCKKVENGGCFVKKWTFSQRRVHYVQYQYFLFYILLILGSAYAPNAYEPAFYTFSQRKTARLLKAGLRAICSASVSYLHIYF